MARTRKTDKGSGSKSKAFSIFEGEDHTADDGQGNATIAYDASHSLTLDHVLRADLVTTEFLIA